ncbi:YeeE/YedE thiosulfate transporter family protein [Abyssisolibacter fermentans]|uniref:YeeE/YedE thiosulfate transporter family protein n=1 Tax=Abyssisolibacter fermentans TaxID=1766203 RepID=UPI000836BA8A|nr:YeeE/YedE thiosulfate transporter family protein [Abyssisolibacter fermentans]
MPTWFKKPWPYWIGGILLGLLNVILLAISGISWQITSGFLLWAVGILQWVGLEPFDFAYFSYFNHYYEPIIKSGNVFINQYTLLNLGVIIGSLVATLLTSQFKIRKIKNSKQLIFGLLGGIMMGYGTRLAVGCNIGTLFSGIPSFSLHAWVFALFIIIGAWVGCKILIKYIIPD